MVWYSLAWFGISCPEDRQKILQKIRENVKNT
jgi:hypothetical protein